MAAAYVNTGHGFNTASGGSIATGATSHTTGNLLVCCVRHEGATTTISLADTAGNSWQPLTKVTHGGGDMHLQLFYVLNCTGDASNVVTATFGANRTFRGIQVMQFSGLNTYDEEDSGTTTAGTSVTAGTVNIDGAGVVVNGIAIYGGLVTWSASTGYTLVQNTSDTQRMGMSYELETGSSAESPGASGSSNDDWIIVSAAFLEYVPKVLDATGAALALTPGNAVPQKSGVPGSGNYFDAKFFGGQFFGTFTAGGSKTLTATGTQLTLSGGTATLKVSRILVGTGTQLTASGGTATLRKDFRLTATGTLLTLSGGTAGFNFTRGMSGTGTALALTGGTATLRADRILVGTGTQLTLSGGTASLRADRILAGTGGVLLLTGGDATMSAGGDKSLDATGSALALSGGTATLRADRILSGEASILSLFGGDATLEVGAGTPAVTGPTPAGGVAGRRKRKVKIGDRMYEVDSLRDVEFLLKRLVRESVPEAPKNAHKPRKKVVGRVSADIQPEAPVAIPVPSVAVDWAPLYEQLAAQEAAYAEILLRVLEKQEEDDIETLLLLL